MRAWACGLPSTARCSSFVVLRKSSVYGSPPDTTRIAAGALTDRPAASPSAGDTVFETPQIASPIARYPVHRQRLPFRRRGRSSASASVNVEAVTTMPAVQKPHWNPAASANACCTGWGCSGVPRPAAVVTARPSSRCAG